MRSKAISDVVAERNRQLLRGFTVQKDSLNNDPPGRLLSCAHMVMEEIVDKEYLGVRTESKDLRRLQETVDHIRDKYANDVRQQLVIAIAMAVAELERRDAEAGDIRGETPAVPGRGLWHYASHAAMADFGSTTIVVDRNRWVAFGAAPAWLQGVAPDAAVPDIDEAWAKHVASIQRPSLIWRNDYPGLLVATGLGRLYLAIAAPGSGSETAWLAMRYDASDYKLLIRNCSADSAKTACESDYKLS